MCKLGVISLERLKIEVKLLLSANTKLYMPCRKTDQDATKFTSLIVFYWLNIMCKCGGVSSGVIAISTALTSQLPPCIFIYRNLSTQKTGQRIVCTSI